MIEAWTDSLTDKWGWSCASCGAEASPQYRTADAAIEAGTTDHRTGCMT